MKYIVTVEDENGMWFEDPDGSDSKADATVLAKRKIKRLQPGHTVVIYSCTMVETFEKDAWLNDE